MKLVVKYNLLKNSDNEEFFALVLNEFNKSTFLVNIPHYHPSVIK